MKVRLDKALQDYMKANGHKDLVLYNKVGSGCCGGAFLYVKARFAKGNDENLLQMGYETMETEIGKLYYDPSQVSIGENAELILNQFLAISIIQVIGIEAVDERFSRKIPL